MQVNHEMYVWERRMWEWVSFSLINVNLQQMNALIEDTDFSITKGTTEFLHANRIFLSRLQVDSYEFNGIHYIWDIRTHSIPTAGASKQLV
jgi:hypothetical protein